MTTAIDLAKHYGIAYYLTPEGACEMHGTDRQIEAFAEAIVASAIKIEREACAKLAEAFVWWETEDCCDDEANTFIAKAIRARK